MCSTKAFAQEFRNQSPTLVGILRAVKSKRVNGHSGEDTSTKILNTKREDLLDSSWRVYEEFQAVFPKDLPKGVPPKQIGREFKIALEPDIAPIHRPIYKLSPLELQKTKTQNDLRLEHGFSRPSQSPWGALVLFFPKKDGSFWFCMD